MRPKKQKRTHEQPLIATARLELLLDVNHELYRLAELIDWDALDAHFGQMYSPDKGRPGIPVRTMAGLLMLQHTFGLSDEQLVARWVENPYYQFFCGEEYFRHDFPVDPSQISRWRSRIGPAGAEVLLKATIKTGQRTRTVSPEQMEVVVVDTTVMEKAVAHPTDARLCQQVHAALLRVARDEGIALRQSYTEVVAEAFLKHGRHMKARQFGRAKKQRKRLKTCAGAVMRDLERKLSEEAFQRHKTTLIRAELILTNPKGGPGKFYSMHAPEVECIAKGKAHKRYEFGVKTSLAVTAKGGFVVGAMACPGNPYDGHTLNRQVVQVRKLTGRTPKRVHVDRGYKGHGIPESRCRVVIAGSKRGIDPKLRREMRRRNAIEPEIGHQKADGKLGRCHLKGMRGDAIHAILCGAGANLRKILARLRLCLYARIRAWLGDRWPMASLVRLLPSWIPQAA